MNSPIIELKNLSYKCDKVTMSVMDERAFEIFFATIYSALNTFKHESRTQKDSINMIDIAIDLINLSIGTQSNYTSKITEHSSNIAKESIQIISDIIKSDFKIGCQEYKEATITRLRVRAMTEFGVNPNTSNTWSQSYRRFGKNAPDIEAINYAKDNIKDFVNYINDRAKLGTIVNDPFSFGETADGLRLFSKTLPLLNNFQQLT